MACEQREWHFRRPSLAQFSSLGNLQESGILRSPKRAGNVEQRAILPPRITRSVALTAKGASAWKSALKTDIVRNALISDWLEIR